MITNNLVSPQLAQDFDTIADTAHSKGKGARHLDINTRNAILAYAMVFKDMSKLLTGKITTRELIDEINSL